MRYLYALVIALALVVLAPPVPKFQCRIVDGAIVASPGVVCTAGLDALDVVYAQTGMSAATAKLMVTDLIDAGFTPSIRKLTNGNYVVTVETDRGNAGTAQQVQTFATNRGVTARVLSVQFE